MRDTPAGRLVRLRYEYGTSLSVETLTPPPPLRGYVACFVPWPSGWAAILDEAQGAYYYHNLVTDETSWVLPVATSPAVSPPPGQTGEELDRKASSSSGTGSTEVVDSKTASKDEILEGRKERTSRRRSSSRRRKGSGDQDKKGAQENAVTDGRDGAKPAKKPGKSRATGVSGVEKLAEREVREVGEAAAAAKEVDGGGAAAMVAGPKATSTTDDALHRYGL